jgi:hypothetical protein
MGIDILRPWGQKIRFARWFWMPLLAFLITRLGILAVAYFSTPIIADSNVPPYHLRPDNILLDVLGSRWDTGFYLSIATEGYRYQGVPLPSVAFFPLLPLAIRAGMLLTGDPLVAGIFVTNLALLGAMILLYRLVSLSADTSTAERSVWYMLIFPVSFFGSAIYSESLFLLTTIGAIYLARQHRWGPATLVAFLAGLTRLMGILLAPVLFIEWFVRLRQAGDSPRPPIWGLVASLGAPLGTSIYMLYLQLGFGDLLAFRQASANWGRLPRSPLETISELFTHPAEGWLSVIFAGRIHLDNWFDFITVIIFITFGIYLLVKKRWSFAAFVLLGASMAISSGLLMSQRRYMWVLFPAFILLAEWGCRPWIDRIIWVFSLLGLGLFTAMFANWYWVG